MKNTTLCYIEKDGKYLMLHRVRKENDENRDKWIGIGGKFEAGESPEDCVLREAREETGLTLLDYRYRGIVTFVSDSWCEYMHLFTADAYEGTMKECDEGTLEWVLPDDTTVISNASYEWVFTPEDSENFTSITGSIVPYSVFDDDFAIGLKIFKPSCSLEFFKSENDICFALFDNGG